MRTRLLLLLSGLLGVWLLSSPLLIRSANPPLPPGAVDPTFGDNGFVTTNLAENLFVNSSARAVAVQPDGKILLAGQVSPGTGQDFADADFALARLHADGALDTTFGDRGIVITNFSDDDLAMALALQPDGKIIAAGCQNYVNACESAVAVRYTAQGVLDATFGDSGRVRLADAYFFVGVAVRDDGKILLAGEGAGAIVLARLLADGAWDPTFGSQGIVRTPLTGGATITSAKMYNDGKIVVAGQLGSECLLVRYLADGALDTAFGAGGIVRTDQGDICWWYDLVVQPDGKVVAAGVQTRYAETPSATEILLARYQANGALDNSFGVGGVVITPRPESPSVRALLRQSDGKLVITGGTDFLAIRYQPNGSLDATFGTGGIVEPVYAANTSYFPALGGNGMAASDGGRIVVAGAVSGYDGAAFGIARLQTDGSLDSAFGQAGMALLPEDGWAEAKAVVLLPDGKVAAAGFTGPPSNPIFTLSRHLSNGLPDPTFGQEGVVTSDVNGPTGARSVLTQGDGKIILGGYAEMTGQDGNKTWGFALARYTTDGALDWSFGGWGKRTLLIGAAAHIWDMAWQNDGKIVAVGESTAEYVPSAAIARFWPDGSLDSSFGVGGVVTQTLGSDFAAHGVAMQPDGKILIAGCSGASIGAEEWVVARYTPAGTLDSAFGSGGIVQRKSGEWGGCAYALALQSDGKIVAVGNALDLSSSATALRLLSNGALDSTFGVGGVVAIGPEVFDEWAVGATAYAVAIQPDGNILVGGQVEGWPAGLALARLQANGALDPGFGANGAFLYPIADSIYPRINSLALQNNGNIVAVGAEDADNRLVVLRLNGAGALDGSFGAGGVVSAAILGEYTRGNDVALLPGGGILVVGETAYVDKPNPQTISWMGGVRLRSDGNLDPTFGSGGKMAAPFGGAGAATALVAQSDGRLVAAGGRKLTRYLADGHLDLSFGMNGRVIPDFDPSHLLLLPDGKILAAGNRFNEAVIARYRTNGEPDISFGSAGQAMGQVGISLKVRALLRQTDGKLLLVGEAEFSDRPPRVVVLRYSAAGAVDSAYGVNGVAFSPAGLPAAAYTGFVKPDGKLLVAGLSDGRSTLWQFAANGQLDTAFGEGGQISGLDIRVHALGLTAEGQIVGAGAWNREQPTIGLLRLHANGRLDPAFSLDGVHESNIGSGANALLVRADGRLLIAAGVDAWDRPPRYTVLSFTADGTLDNTFGTPAGWSRIPIHLGAAESILDLAALPDGRLLAIGYRNSLVRYTPDGALDSTFGDSGVVQVTGSLSGLAVQPDGRFLATVFTGCANARWVWPPPDCARLDLHRYLPNGAPDPTFGVNGVVTDTYGGEINTLFLQPDGKILLANRSVDGVGEYDKLLMARYHANGQPDLSFGSQGQVNVPNLNGYALALQGDGKILASGDRYTFAVVRFTPNGVLDSSFGVAGVARTEFGPFGSAQAQAIAVQPDGKILLAGYHRDASGKDIFALARFDSVGKLDPTFGQNGRVLTDFNSPAKIRKLLLEADGKILAIGQSGERIVVARYQPDGRADDGFGRYGRVVTAFGGFPSQVYAAALHSDQKVVVGGSAFTGRDKDLALLRFQIGSPPSTATPTATSTGSTPAPPSDTPTVTPTPTATPTAPLSKCGLIPGASTHLCVAYIHGGNLADAEDFRQLLEGEGFQVNLVSQYAAAGYKFTTDWAILIGADTDISPQTAGYILDTGLPVVAIGRGGFLFFYGQRLFSQVEAYYAVYGDPLATIVIGGQFLTPDAISPGRTCIGKLCSFPYQLSGGGDPYQFVVDVYQSEAAVRGQVSTRPINWPGAYQQLRGDAPGWDWLTIFPDCYAYWHFDGPPSGMTSEGRRLFINTLYRNSCRRAGVDVSGFRALGLGLAVPVPETGSPVELSAAITVPVGFEIEGCVWSGLPAPLVEGFSNDTCHYGYRPTAGPGPGRESYGPQRTTLTVTYRHQETGVTDRLVKEFTFNVFFPRDGDDDQDEQPNWFEYWGDDGAVPNLRRSDVVYDPTLEGYYGRYCKPGATRCASQFRDKVSLGPVAATDDDALSVPQSTACPGLNLLSTQGIDTCARTIVHEAKHKTVYHQQYDPTGIYYGFLDSDCNLTTGECDSLCDDYERLVVGTDSRNVDSCNLRTLIHKDYAKYGDEEFVARQTEKDVWGNAAQDWANPGKQAPKPSVAAVEWVQAAGLPSQRSGRILAGETSPRYFSFLPLAQTGEASQPTGPQATALDLPPDSAILLGRYRDAGVDANSDGLWESLRLTVDVQVRDAATYNLVAWLADQQGADFVWAATSANLGVGEQSVDLIFDGLLMWGAASDGPYRVSRVELRRGVDEQTLDAAEQVHITAVYTRTYFTPPAIALRGDFANTMLDTDQDQRIDTVRFQTGLDVYTRGVYTVTGELHGSNGYIGAANVQALLEVGQRSVVLDFPGEAVYFRHFSGPLSLRQVRAEDGAGRVWDWRTDAATTASYTAFDFQHDRRMWLTSGFTDRGLDSDGDGKYDYLEISVQIFSSERAVYWLSAELVDEQSAAHTSLVQPVGLEALVAGQTMTVTLLIPGPAIHRMGVDGSLRVESLTIRTGDGRTLLLRPLAHVTSRYRYTDFATGVAPIHLPIIRR